MFFSFDVFDTCLTRIHARPTDLFHDLAIVFLKIYCPYGYDHDSIACFIKNRISAERQIRNAFDNMQEDITLFEIYCHLQTLLPWRFNIEEAMMLEMQIEKESLRPILPIQQRISSLRKQGFHVIFISDMYLPTYFIRQCLIDHNIADNDDHIYVSSDIGLTKHSGNLYKRVLEIENIKPDQLYHCGDNFHSDIRMAQKHGIQTEYFMSSHLTNYEQQYLKRVKPYDILSYSKLASTCRLARTNSFAPDKSDTLLNRLSSNVIAPLLTAYILWVLNDAKQKGIKRLYFVSRDGQILYKIAQKFKHRQDFPACHYLYGSRQAWYLPAVTQINKTELEWLAQLHDCKTPRNILIRLNTTPEEVKENLLNFNITNFDNELNAEELTNFWRFLKSPDVESIILKKAELSLNSINHYFHQEGLWLDDKWAIVDTGWRLTCQKALRKILNLCNYQGSVKGYYLGVRKDHVPLSQVGEVFPFISHSQSGLSGLKTYDWLFNQGVASVIENVFTIADHPPVIGFQLTNSKVDPIFKENFFKPEIQILRKEIENFIFNYINLLQKEINVDDHLSLQIDCALKSAKLFFTHPSKQDMKAICWVPIDIEQFHDEENSRTLANPLTISDLMRMALYVLNPNKGRFIDTHHAWYQGSAAISKWPIRLLFSLSTSTYKHLLSISQHKKYQ